MEVRTRVQGEEHADTLSSMLGLGLNPSQRIRMTLLLGADAKVISGLATK